MTPDSLVLPVTAMDRRLHNAALDQPCFKVYVDGIGMSKSFWQGRGAPGEFETYQVVRVSATSAGDACRRIVDALGREPDGLRVGTSDA